jgi:hypothetical protein
MARNTTKPGLGSRDQRIFASPVALGFVRTVVARRGIIDGEGPIRNSRKTPGRALSPTEAALLLLRVQGPFVPL